MAKQQPRAQKETVGRVMHEFKHGELRMRGTGPKVKNPKQAIAIALREAGASKHQSRSEKQKALRKTKAKEHRGETAEARSEGGKTRADLYAEARRRDIPGRSKMSKAELKRALYR